jgi:hypothetical protein
MSLETSYFSDASMALKKECESLYPEILTLRHALRLEGVDVDSGSFMTDYATSLTSLRDLMAAEKTRLDDLMRAIRSV